MNFDPYLWLSARFEPESNQLIRFFKRQKIELIFLIGLFTRKICRVLEAGQQIKIICR